MLRRGIRILTVGVVLGLSAPVCSGPAEAAGGARYPIQPGTVRIVGGRPVPGGFLQVIASSFVPGTLAKFNITPSRQVAAAMRVGPTGRLTGRVPLPRNLSLGGHTLMVRGPAPSGGTTLASTAFVVRRRVALRLAGTELPSGVALQVSPGVAGPVAPGAAGPAGRADVAGARPRDTV